MLCKSFNICYRMPADALVWTNGVLRRDQLSPCCTRVSFFLTSRNVFTNLHYKHQSFNEFEMFFVYYSVEVVYL